MGQSILYFIGYLIFAFFPFGVGLDHALLSFGAMVLLFLAFLFQRASVLAVALILNLAIRFSTGDQNLPYYIISFSIGLYCYAAMVHLRCPRCKTALGMSWSRWHGIDNRPWCLACGRSKDDVKPFQHFRKPEAWDGQYHNEGGGEQTDSALLWTERARDRWLKR